MCLNSVAVPHQQEAQIKRYGTGKEKGKELYVGVDLHRLRWLIKGDSTSGSTFWLNITSDVNSVSYGGN